MPVAQSSATGGQAALIERLLSDGSVRRSAYLLAAGVRAQALADAARTGVVVKAAPGVYHLPESGQPSPRRAVAIACVRAPKAIVCLLSAAHLCDLIDDPSPVTWLAQPVGSHVPRPGEAQERILHWSYDGAFDVGVVLDEICGVALRRTAPARTIVDLFRHARYLSGETAGLQAGARYIEQGGTSSAILDVADQLATPMATMRRLVAAVEQWQHTTAA